MENEKKETKKTTRKTTAKTKKADVPVEYHKNPRVISDFEMKRLKENIEVFGDISGIVHDIETNEIIAGNQRSKAIEIDKCEIKIIDELDKPDKQGTIAWGFIIAPDGTQMSYRRVKWNEEQRELVNITANKLGGQWDWEILNSDDWNKDTLVKAGFDYLDFDQDSVNINDDNEDGKSAGKTRPTRFFTLEVLFPNKDDYTTVVEIIDNSRETGETIAETLKRLLVTVHGQQS